MPAVEPRVVVVVVGDLIRDANLRTKEGLFFNALARRFPLVIHDASLRGLARIMNALCVLHPNRRRWRQRLHMNVPGFVTRSRRTAAFLRTLGGPPHVILQDGVLLDALWEGGPMPSLIYTDYTARLAAQAPAAGRSPFTPRELRAWLALERRALERAAHVCTWGEVARQSLLADYGLRAGQVTAVGGGVNFDPLPPPVTRDTGRRPTALFIGKELYRKGGDVLLRAFAQARAQVPEARLVFLTRDPIPAGLPRDGVEVVEPTWDREAIAALYRRADVFVLPSRLETWGDVILEAMAFGLPCIGIAGQAMEEIIDHEATGLVVPAGDVGRLATALTRLLADGPLRLRWGQAGRRRVEAHYTWDHVVNRLAPIIESTLWEHRHL